MRTRKWVAMAVVTASVLVPVATAVAATASPPHWRIARVTRDCGNEGLASVAATGPRDAWAIGEPYGNGPRCGMDVLRWDGTAWAHVPLPRGTFIGNSFTPPVTATSRANAWVFPVRFGHIGLSTFSYNYALRWNGRAWHQTSFPVHLLLDSAVALGTRDVFAFGSVYRKEGAPPVPYEARYNGRAWHRVAMPGAPLAAAASSPHDLWAVGPTTATAGKVLANQVIVAMRWTGRRWLTVRAPAIRAHRGQRYLGAAAVVAAGPRNLWWAYRLTTGEPTPVTLLHWNGTRWRSVRVPAGVAGLDTMTQDGRGGLWLLCDVSKGLDEVQYWYHYSAGQWTRQAVPSPKGFNTTLFGMAWVPRTDSVWAVGEADANYGNKAVGVIDSYAP